MSRVSGKQCIPRLFKRYSHRLDIPTSQHVATHGNSSSRSSGTASTISLHPFAIALHHTDRLASGVTPLRILLVLLIGLAGSTARLAHAQKSLLEATTASACYAVRIERSPHHGQVFQQSSDGHATVKASGSVVGNASSGLQFRVMRRNQVVHGLDWTELSIDQNGNWHLDDITLPRGGPYRLEWMLVDADDQILDTRSVHDVFVGDLWVLAGQSNMDGCGRLDDPAVEQPSEGVRAFSLAAEWSIAEDPLHDCYEAAYAVYRTTYAPHMPGGRAPIEYRRRGPWPTYQENREEGAGLGVAFGKRIYEETGIPIGLVICSLGGTTMAHWNPHLHEEGENSLYGAFKLRLQDVGGQVTGVLWYQGESEGQPGGYREAMVELIEAMRRDSGNPSLPFYLVQLAPTGLEQPKLAMQRSGIRDVQRSLAELPRVEVASAIDLALMPGSVHLNTPSYVRIGNRLANVALADVYNVAERLRGPRLESIRRYSSSPQVLSIRFSQVNGKLYCEAATIDGFSIRNDEGQELVAIVEASFDNAGQSVNLRAAGSIPEEAKLWYAFGTNPQVSIVDDRDMAVPAFGPIEIPAGE